MGRGPGTKRRFDNYDYVIAEKFVAGALPGTMTHEQRQKEAQYRATMLRNAGMNVRVVNGAGWTALYSRIPTQRQPIPKRKERPVKKPLLLPPPNTNTPTRETTADLEWLKTSFSWVKELGLPEPKKKEAPPTNRTNTLIALINKGLTTRMKEEENFFEKNGMGYWIPQIEITPKSRVTGFGIIDPNEAEALVETMTKEQGVRAFKSWVHHAGANKETRWRKGGQSQAATEEMFRLMRGDLSFKEAKQTESKGMFVIEVDGEPAFWSPIGSQFSEDIKRQFKRGSKADNFTKKGDEGTMGNWNRVIDTLDDNAQPPTRQQYTPGGN